MAKPYSQDLRDRVIDAVKRSEMSRRAAARYEISRSVAIKWLERVERDGSREPVGHGGHRASKLMAHRDFLEAARAEKSDVTLQALCDRLSAERGDQNRHLDDEPLLSPDRRHVQRPACRIRAGSPRHKSPPQTMANLSRLIDPRRLVFIDETWTKTNEARLRGWAPRESASSTRSRRAVEDRDFHLAALRNDRIDAPCLFDGPINGERFHAYVEQFLVPTLKPGDVVIDNLGSTKERRCGRRSGMSEPSRVPAEILARPQSDRAGLRQVQNSAASGSEATRRSPTPAAKSSPNTRPPNAPHTSRTQDTRRPKSRTL